MSKEGNKADIFEKIPKSDYNIIFLTDLCTVDVKRRCLGILGIVENIVWFRNHARSQFHNLMKASFILILSYFETGLELPDINYWVLLINKTIYCNRKDISRFHIRKHSIFIERTVSENFDWKKIFRKIGFSVQVNDIKLPLLVVASFLNICFNQSKTLDYAIILFSS